MSSSPQSPNVEEIRKRWPNWLEHWPDGLVALDTTGKIVWLSEKAVRILGWAPADVLGGHVHDVLCLNNREFRHAKHECPLTLRQSEDGPAMNSANWLSASGHFVCVDYRVQVFEENEGASRLISFFETRLKQHNFAELEKFAGFVDKNPASIAEFDYEGQMLFGNPAMQELLLKHGFDENGLAQIFPHNIAEICTLCCREKRSFTDVALKIGGDFYCWHFHPLQSQEEFTAIGYAFDVTEQKRAEEHARVTRAQARRDFYAKMMHELRTPLNAIVGYSDLVLCRSADKLNERDTRALQGIKAGGMQLNELISDTLDISKIEAGRMTTETESFAVQLVVDDIHEQMHYLATVKKLTYDVSCEADLVVNTDRRKVRQILVNLVSNAIKYTKKGTVSVTIHSVKDGNFMMRVADTGIGIPQEQIEGLFLAYQRVQEHQNRSIQGTGLGLALVHELVAILDGTIDVESVYGEGSAFTVLLPMEHHQQI